MQRRIPAWPAALTAALLVAGGGCRAEAPATRPAPTEVTAGAPADRAHAHAHAHDLHDADGAVPRRGPDKPRAPVDVQLARRPLGGGAYEVTLSATPGRDVTVLDLVLDGKVVAAGPTRAGQVRTLTARVELGDGRGKQLAGSAIVEVGPHRRRAAAVTWLGPAPAAAEPPLTIVRLPDGTEAAEVRP